MARRTLLFAAFLLISPAIAFADADDDDTYWGYFDEYSCEELCDAVEVCDAACYTDNCIELCEKHFRSRVKCLEMNNCDDLRSCFCQPAEELGDGGCGCDVSHSETGSALTFLMLAIGLLALWISARREKAKSD